jgi:hypothetical protein
MGAPSRSNTNDWGYIAAPQQDGVSLATLLPQRSYFATIPLSQRDVNAPPRALSLARYAPRGIVGVDIAGPRPNVGGPYPYRNLRPLVQQAREAASG